MGKFPFNPPKSNFEPEISKRTAQFVGVGTNPACGSQAPFLLGFRFGPKRVSHLSSVSGFPQPPNRGPSLPELNFGHLFGRHLGGRPRV